MNGYVNRFLMNFTDRWVEDQYSLLFVITLSGRSPRHHGRQRQNQDIQHVEELGVILSGALHVTQYPVSMPTLSSP